MPCFWWSKKKEQQQKLVPGSESNEGYKPNQSDSEQKREYRKAMDAEFHSSMKCAARDLTYKNKEEQVAWLPKYEDEETHGVAILQRQRRLQGGERAPQSMKQSDKLPVSSPTSDKPPAYDEPLSTLDQGLKQLRVEYKKHLYRLEDLRYNRVHGALSQQFILRHIYEDEQHRSRWWHLNSSNCASTEGCCSRSCGCCEKPLRELLRPTPDGGKEVARIYGHCTAECACCIHHQRFYTPDPCLPPTVLEP